MSITHVVFDEFFPFDPGTTGAASANATRWRKMGQLWAPDGVRANFLNTLTATISSGTVTVQSGAVFIHGYYAEIQSSKTLNTTGGTLTGIGTVVAQASLNTASELIQIVYRDGVTDYGPNPTNNFEQDLDPLANFWEIPLWGVNAGAVTDLRTMVSGGSGVTWSGGLDAPQSIATGATSPLSMAQFLVARISYPGFVKADGTALLTFGDLSTAQTITCQLSYQQGVSGEAHLVPATPVVPQVSGWPGLSGETLSIPISLSGIIPVIPGRKLAGWQVTAGSGPDITVSNMTMSMRLITTGPTA